VHTHTSTISRRAVSPPRRTPNRLVQRTLMLCLVCLSFSSLCGAAKLPKIGVKSGLVLSDTWGPESKQDGRYKFGATIGIPVLYELTESLILQSELLYVMKGTRKDSSQGYGEAKFPFYYRLDYISVPIMAKLYLDVSSAIRPYLSLGAGINYLLFAEEVFKKYQAGKGSEYRYSIKDQSNVIDPTLEAAVGVDIRIGRHDLLLDARFSAGFLDWNTDRISKNMAGLATIGIGFNLQKEKQWW